MVGNFGGGATTPRGVSRCPWRRTRGKVGPPIPAGVRRPLVSEACSPDTSKTRLPRGMMSSIRKGRRKYAPEGAVFFRGWPEPVSPSATNMSSTPTLLCRETLYADLRRAAGNVLKRRRPGLLQPTALVHEAFLRLRRSRNAQDIGRTAFVVAAVGEMRRVLIDYVRAEQAAKRGGEVVRVPLDTAVLALPEPTIEFSDLREALERLAALSPRQAQVVELRFFGGLNEEEVAEALAISRRTVQADWRGARAWLRRELAADDRSAMSAAEEPAIRSTPRNARAEPASRVL